MKTIEFDISFRCYYADGEPTNHRQTMKLKDIQKWIESYKLTHPKYQSITIKIWFDE